MTIHGIVELDGTKPVLAHVTEDNTIYIAAEEPEENHTDQIDQWEEIGYTNRD